MGIYKRGNEEGKTKNQTHFWTFKDCISLTSITIPEQFGQEINDIFNENKVEDKSFLHKNHPGNQKDKFHIKITLESYELKKLSKIESNKKIYKILEQELNKFIHSIQILIL